MSDILREGTAMTGKVTITYVDDGQRQCGECTLCCKLLPVRELEKAGGVRCKHQSHAKGCRVYGTDKMPPSCKLWNCAWLSGNPVGPRPDRAHYVVDIMPDYVTIVDNETGKKRAQPVVQVWLDPRHPDAHRNPVLRSYLAKRGEAALIRTSPREGFVLVPPSMSHESEWIEVHTNLTKTSTHSWDQIRHAITTGEVP